MSTAHPRLSHFALVLVTGACSLSTPLPAQQHLSAPRSDGHSTPFLLYSAAGAVSGCAPLAVISHGAGGSEDGYRYLAQAVANLGYTTVVMGHAESGLDALRADMLSYGVMEGLTELVADPSAEQARLLDVGAVLRRADSRCRAPFRVLLGHSMGAETVMLEAAGEMNRISNSLLLGPEN